MAERDCAYCGIDLNAINLPEGVECGPQEGSKRCRCCGLVVLKDQGVVPHEGPPIADAPVVVESSPFVDVVEEEVVESND